VVCAVIGVVVAFLRPEGTIRSLTITFAVLIAVFAVGMLCAVFLPGMSG
jgi:type III secretory pathway component EscS